MVEKQEGVGRKRGRRPKNEKKEYVLNKEQMKFILDLSDDKETREIIFDLLIKANKKDHGREIQFKDLVILSLAKLNEKDIEKLQEASLTEMEKVERTLQEYNRKNSLNLSMGEFLMKKLGIN